MASDMFVAARYLRMLQDYEDSRFILIPEGDDAGHGGSILYGDLVVSEDFIQSLISAGQRSTKQ